MRSSDFAHCLYWINKENKFIDINKYRRGLYCLSNYYFILFNLILVVYESANGEVVACWVNETRGSA